MISFVEILFDGKTCTCLCPGKIVAVGIDGWFDDEGIGLIVVGVEDDNYKIENKNFFFY